MEPNYPDCGHRFHTWACSKCLSEARAEVERLRKALETRASIADDSMGLCDARGAEVERLRAENERLDVIDAVNAAVERWRVEHGPCAPGVDGTDGE